VADRSSARLRLVPAVVPDDPRQAAREEHPSNQPRLTPLDDTVFTWHGLIQHERGETPCCQQAIEVTNLVNDQHGVANDIVAMLSTVLHAWDGHDVMVLVSITPPVDASGVTGEGPTEL